MVGSPAPAPTPVVGSSTDPADYDNAEFSTFNAAANSAPVPGPAPTAELAADADYDNAEFSAGGGTLASAAAVVQESDYDNAEFAAPYS